MEELLRVHCHASSVLGDGFWPFILHPRFSPSFTEMIGDHRANAQRGRAPMPPHTPWPISVQIVIVLVLGTRHGATTVHLSPAFPLN